MLLMVGKGCRGKEQWPGPGVEKLPRYRCYWAKKLSPCVLLLMKPSLSKQKGFHFVGRSLSTVC